MKKAQSVYLYSRALLYLTIYSFCVMACGDDKESIKEDSIIIDEGQSAFSLTAEDTSVSVNFTALLTWTAKVKEANDWLALSPDKGISGIKTLNISLKKNTGETARTATVVIESSTTRKEISITQAGSLLQTMDEADVPDFGKYYKPNEFRNINMLRNDAKWSWFRSKQSEHFVVFWEAGFGDDPNAATVPSELRVNIDDLLTKAETFYQTNIALLKFAQTGSGTSYLDKYKMQIYLHYTTEWMAYGSGYDNVIGALWVNPGTCQPAGSTIAHEIGHSFQYQVYCDKLLNGAADNARQGFRYGYEGSNGGNAFWEQCAQWQSFQDYPGELFGYHIDVWKANYHRHFEHEWMRYASYWLQYYWAQKNGVDAIGEIWKQSNYPEDAISTYLRLYCNNDLQTLYSQLYDYASRMATYDIDAIRPYATESARSYKTKLFATNDNYYQVAYASCPGTTGFNVISLNVPGAGTTVKADFVGLNAGSSLSADDPGSIIDGDGNTVSSTRTYNNAGNTTAGWRYGFVAVVDGTARYSPMYQSQTETVSYTVPAGATNLYFVVMGAPGQYVVHPWNENEADDAQWPYKVRFENTDLAGNVQIDTNADPKDETFTYNVSCNSSAADYLLGTIDLQSNGDIRKLAQAFVMKPDVLSANTLNIANGITSEPTEGKIALGLQQSDNTYSYTYSANAGFYCTAEGNKGSWGNGDPIWFEYDKDNFVITYGHYPGKTTAGQKCAIKPVLVYTKGGVKYKVTFVINMQF